MLIISIISDTIFYPCKHVLSMSSKILRVAVQPILEDNASLWPTMNLPRLLCSKPLYLSSCCWLCSFLLYLFGIYVCLIMFLFNIVITMFLIINFYFFKINRLHVTCIDPNSGGVKGNMHPQYILWINNIILFYIVFNTYLNNFFFLILTNLVYVYVYSRYK